MRGYSRARMDDTQYPSQFLHTVGTIVDRFAGTAYHATLPNGKVVVAFLEKKNEMLTDKLLPGDKVELCICPADFERARIDGIAEQKGK